MQRKLREPTKWFYHQPVIMQGESGGDSDRGKYAYSSLMQSSLGRDQSLEP